VNTFLVALCSLVLAGSMASAGGRPGGGGGHSSGGGRSGGGGAGRASAPVRSAPVRSAPVRSAPVQRAPIQRAPVQHTPVQHAPVQHAPVSHQPVNHGGGTANHGGQTNHGGQPNHGGGTVNHGGGQNHGGYAHSTHGTYQGSRNVTINNRTYVSRTYVNNRGVRYNGYYAPRAWGGRPYYAFYGHWGYSAPFWGLYWNPWTPFAWTWAWAVSPWYVNYWGWYYRPYVTYVYPYQYSTDYAYQDTLDSAYQAGVAAGQAMSNSSQGGAPVSEQDHNQLAQQTSDMSKDMENGKDIDVQAIFNRPDYLSYLFVMNDSRSFVPDNGSAACGLTGGDLFKIVEKPADTTVDTVKLMVTSVKPGAGSCPAGTQFSLSVSDLQEMLNSWAERVEKGNHDFEAKKVSGQAPTVSRP
jgi:hypothetical protein